MTPQLPDEKVQRLVALTAQAAEKTDAWTAAANVLRRQPPQVIAALAEKLLVDRYFRLRDIADGNADFMTMPLRKKKPTRQRGPRAPRTPEYEAELQRIRQDCDTRFWASIKRTVDIFERELKAEWTAEVLAGSFIGASGELVTWADATIEDHRAAVQDAESHMALAGMKHGSHTKAIADLEAAGATSLGALVTTVAA